MLFMTRTLLMTIITAMPAISFAMFCPNNFNQINVGDSIEQVTSQCGTPTLLETHEQDGNIPQEWSYFIPQTVAASTTQQEQGTLKTSVTFDDQGKAINISVNGLGVGATTICGSPIQLGATRDQVKSACGEPSFVNKQSVNPMNPLQQPTKVSELTYKTPVKTFVLIFENGKLVDRR